MNERGDLSGPQFRADRPIEQETVRTTIVGGRPPGSGQPLGPIPRGIEVLIKKAAIDAEFRSRLLAGRAAAAAEIGLVLDPAEALMLAAAEAAQIEAIIARTSVPQEHRRAFLGQAAAAMLAALGFVTVPGCDDSKGIRPDEKHKEGAAPPDQPPPKVPERTELSKGDRPDLPPPRPPIKGIQPDLPPPPEGIEDAPPPPATLGIQPDLPPLNPPKVGGHAPDLPPPRPAEDSSHPPSSGFGGVRPDLPPKLD